MNIILPEVRFEGQESLGNPALFKGRVIQPTAKSLVNMLGLGLDLVDLCERLKVSDLVKSQLHFHTNLDPLDSAIVHSPKEAIDFAFKNGYKVISFTHHREVILDNEWINYALDKGILFIPGVEIEINGAHVLIFNPDKDAENIKTFKDLMDYRISYPDILVIAPHPFYGMESCLGNGLIRNIDLFDGIEFSLFYTKFFGKRPNEKVVKVAEKFGKTILGTGDVHGLEYMDHCFSLVGTNLDYTNLNIDNYSIYMKEFFKNVVKGKVIPVSLPFSPLEYFLYTWFHLKMSIKTGKLFELAFDFIKKRLNCL